MGMHENPTLIVPRRNFLIRALGFTAVGATLPISIITADDARTRMNYHQAELKKAWHDYYGPNYNVRDNVDIKPVGTIEPPSVNSHGYKFGASYATSVFFIVAGGGKL
jgi:YD repeat-containing protein